MPRSNNVLKPTNRHLLIIPHYKEKDKTESGVLLPNDFTEKQNPYIRATVVDIADDCSPQFKHIRRNTFDENKDVIVDSSMIEEIVFGGKKNFLVLENYIVGLLRGL